MEQMYIRRTNSLDCNVIGNCYIEWAKIHSVPILQKKHFYCSAYNHLTVIIIIIIIAHVTRSTYGVRPSISQAMSFHCYSERKHVQGLSNYVRLLRHVLIGF